MRKLATLVGLVVALGAAYFAYQAYLTRSGVATAPPQQQIDVVAIRTQLLAMAQAERQYLVTRETYGTLEQLQKEGLLPGGTEMRGYTFTAVVDGNRGFAITATPTAPEKSTWPVLLVDHTMQVTTK